MKSSHPQLSIIIPAYNEESRLPPTLDKIQRYMSKKKLEYELILVNNASNDKTPIIMKEFRERNGFTKVLTTEKKGKGLAVKTGIMAASGRYILFTDADLPTPIEEIEKFISCLSNGNDLAYGTRNTSQSKILVKQPFLRRLLGKAMKLYTIIFIFPRKPRPTDTQCGFKMYKKKVARELFRRQTLNGGMFDVEIMYIAKKHHYKMSEVSVIWENKKQSKVNIIKSVITNPFKLLSIPLKDFLGYYN